MNQDFNNTNQDNYNTQGNNGIPNNQPLDNDINNTYSQPQQTNTNMYQQPLSQVNTPINNTYQQSIMQDHIQQRAGSVFDLISFHGSTPPSADIRHFTIQASATDQGGPTGYR